LDGLAAILGGDYVRGVAGIGRRRTVWNLIGRGHDNGS
jgi:hypothetical protein